jgi:hypothetical protein
MAKEFELRRVKIDGNESRSQPFQNMPKWRGVSINVYIRLGSFTFCEIL